MWLAIFVGYPYLALALGAVFIGFGLKTSTRSLTFAGISWLLYGAYEYGMKARWLCAGECNIRVDLLLIYPVLAVVTIVAVVKAIRRRHGARSRTDS